MNEDAWASLQRHLLQMLDAACAVLLPAAVFMVALLKYDALHASLLLGVGFQALHTSLCVLPSLRIIAPKHVQHRAMRWYTAAVLCAMYVEYVGGLEAFGHALQPSGLHKVLSAVGLWAVSETDMLPFLAIFLLVSPFGFLSLSFGFDNAQVQHAADQFRLRIQASLHSGTGGVLRNGWTGARDWTMAPTVGRVPTWRAPWLIHTARKVSTYGPYLIACCVYALVLLDCDISALGLGYVALAALVLAVRPVTGQWLEVGAHHSMTLQHIMLGSDSYGDSRRSRIVLRGSPSVCWVPLTALALVSASDLATQAVLPAVVSSEWPVQIPSGVLDFLQDAIGVDPYAQGRDLALRLLRPGIILGALVLFRQLYCLGTLHRQLQRMYIDDAALEQLR